MGFKIQSFMLPGILAAIAFILSIIGGAWCEFISFTAEDDSTADPVTLSFGIFNYLGYSTRDTILRGTVTMESCNVYPDDTVEIDTRWRSARAFSGLTIIIGGVVTFWVLLSWCARGVHRAKSLLRCAGMMYMLCCLFQGLTLLFLTSNACNNNGMVGLTASALTNLPADFSGEFPSTCAMASGGKATIAATVLWFAAALAALYVDPPISDPITVESQNVTYTKNKQADGTDVVTEMVVKGEPVPVNGNSNGAVKESAAVEQAV